MNVTKERTYVQPAVGEVSLEYEGFLCISPITPNPNVIDYDEEEETELVIG